MDELILIVVIFGGCIAGGASLYFINNLVFDSGDSKEILEHRKGLYVSLSFFILCLLFGYQVRQTNIYKYELYEMKREQAEANSNIQR